jgi:hypothetical protein
MSYETVHVYLPREAVEVWVPVDAVHIRGDVYRIVDCRGEDDEVEFGKGVVVRCRKQVMSGDFGKITECLVAYEAVREDDPDGLKA